MIFKGVPQIPYEVLTIPPGFIHQPLVPIIPASNVPRDLRFFLAAALLYWFRPPIRNFIERRLTLLPMAGVALLVGGIAAVKFLPKRPEIIG